MDSLLNFMGLSTIKAVGLLESASTKRIETEHHAWDVFCGNGPITLTLEDWDST